MKNMRSWKRRIFALTTALLLVVSVCALAETDLSGYSISSGNVVAPEFFDVTAPYSGTLMSFDLAAGDRVTAGQELFHMLENYAYAPENGTVVKFFVNAGDDAKAKSSIYGGVCAIEPEKEYMVSATTTDSYQNNDNKVLHVGEKLYFKSAKADKTEGEGTVVSVSATGYTVEIDKGKFELKDSFNLYRSDSYSQKENVGKGVVVRRDATFVPAEGRIGAVIAQEGSKISAGDKLFTILSNDAAPESSPSVTVPADGIVAQVAVQCGQQVWKGQLLARIYSESSMEITADVDEIDLKNIRVGDNVYYTLDTDAQNVQTGEITEISSLGLSKQNAAYFTVHVSISPKNVRIGQSVSLYLPK